MRFAVILVLVTVFLAAYGAPIPNHIDEKKGFIHHLDNLLSRIARKIDQWVDKLSSKPICIGIGISVCNPITVNKSHNNNTNIIVYSDHGNYSSEVDGVPPAGENDGLEITISGQSCVGAGISVCDPITVIQNHNDSHVTIKSSVQDHTQDTISEIDHAADTATSPTSAVSEQTTDIHKNANSFNSLEVKDIDPAAGMRVNGILTGNIVSGVEHQGEIASHNSDNEEEEEDNRNGREEGYDSENEDEDEDDDEGTAVKQGLYNAPAIGTGRNDTTSPPTLSSPEKSDQNNPGWSTSIVDDNAHTQVPPPPAPSLPINRTTTEHLSFNRTTIDHPVSNKPDSSVYHESYNRTTTNSQYVDPRPFNRPNTHGYPNYSPSSNTGPYHPPVNPPPITHPHPLDRPSASYPPSSRLSAYRPHPHHSYQHFHKRPSHGRPGSYSPGFGRPRSNAPGWKRGRQ